MPPSMPAAPLVALEDVAAVRAVGDTEATRGLLVATGIGVTAPAEWTRDYRCGAEHKIFRLAIRWGAGTCHHSSSLGSQTREEWHEGPLPVCGARIGTHEAIVLRTVRGAYHGPPPPRTSPTAAWPLASSR